MQDTTLAVMKFVSSHPLVYIVGLTLGVWVIAAPPSELFATHENDHRFVVEGHITESNGNAIPNAKVFIRSEVLETGVTAFSDQAGFYSALLHLHNADAGTSITVTAFEATEHITADFDPADKTTVRTGVVNIVHTIPIVDDESVRSDTSVYLTWGIVALAVGVSVGVITRKWARRRKAQSA